MSVVNRSTKSVFSSLKTVFQFFLRNIYVDEDIFPKRAHRFTAIYSRDKEYLWVQVNIIFKFEYLSILFFYFLTVSISDRIVSLPPPSVPAS